MPVHLGGAQAYKQFVKGDIVMSLQWVNDEPAMAIWPKQRRTLNNNAFVVCLSSAYLYDDVPYLIEMSAKAAEFIGLEVSKFTITNIATMIHDHLQDLIEMPPKPRDAVKPPSAEDVIGEMIMKVDGETIVHEEVTVPEGMR